MKNNKNFRLNLLFILSLILVVTSVSAFKQNTAVDISRPCLINGTWCSSAAQCNLTISDPDGNKLITNKLMTNQISFHNITLTQSQSLILGEYTADMVCCDRGLCGAETFNYNISPSGYVGSISFFIIMIIIVYLILGFGIYFREITTTILGGMFLIMLGIYIMNNGVDVYRNFITEAFALFSISFGGYWSVKAGLEQMDII